MHAASHLLLRYSALSTRMVALTTRRRVGAPRQNPVHHQSVHLPWAARPQRLSLQRHQPGLRSRTQPLHSRLETLFKELMLV